MATTLRFRSVGPVVLMWLVSVFAIGLAARPAFAISDGILAAVVPFSGPQSKIAQTVVERLTRKYAAAVPAAVWSRAVKRLNADNHNPEEIAQVASEVGARLVITGSVRREGARFLLLVLIRDGRSGEIRDRFRYVLPGPTVPPSVEDQLARDFGDSFPKIVELVAGMPAQSFPTTAVPPAPQQQPTTTTNDEPTPARRDTRASQNDDEPSNTNDPRTSAYFSLQRPLWAPFFDVAFGASISNRSMRVSPDSETAFKSTAVGGVRFDAILYPLAPLHRIAQGVVSGIGLALHIEKPFWPKSNADEIGEGLRLGTSELRVEGGLHWRFTLYAKRPWPELVFMAGGGTHQFAIERAADGSDFGPPNTTYNFVSVGGALRVMPIEKRLRLWFAANYLHVPKGNAGAIERPDRYGPSQTVAFRVEGGVEVFAYKGLKLIARGYFERYILSFTTVPGTSRRAELAIDKYAGGALSVGYEW